MTIQDIVAQLYERSRFILGHAAQDSKLTSILGENLPSLTLGRAFLEKIQLLEEHPRLPQQIAVLGPTQSGKSTVVNLLLAEEAAGVSPLAGYTIHPQVFVQDNEPVGLDWLSRFFPGYQAVATTELPRDRYDFIGTRIVTSNNSALPSPVMIWDTPDFDSIAADNYREGVIRTAALADLLVVVVSKDKYADESVWEMLRLLDPLRQPTLVCLNKARPIHRETLLNSWQDKWRRYRQDDPAPVLALPYEPDLEQLHKASGPLFSQHLPTVLKHIDRSRYQDRIKAFVRQHWPAWTEPVRAEIEAQQIWQTLVDDVLQQAIEIYRHDYLDHPYAYETSQRALAELLILLEIPGLAKPMMYFRKAITWPIRAVFKRKPARAGENAQELVILQNAVEHALLQLLQATQEKSQSQSILTHWWRDLAAHLRENQSEWKRQFQAAVTGYYQSFQPHVEEAAQELYLKLKEMPATLNSLRATRVTADAAAIALVLQTGGIGPHDFVLAPAVLSLTSMLTESALGKYLDRVADRLKKKQLDAVRSMLKQQLQQPLQSLPQRLQAQDSFGIDQSTLEAMESLLQEKQYGLKSLFK